MAVSSGIPGQGTLTGPGTKDTIRTGVGTEAHTITFTNYSANTVTLTIWLNGTANQNLAGPPVMTLLAGEAIVFECKLGLDDYVKTEASAASAIAWTDEMDSLTT